MLYIPLLNFCTMKYLATNEKPLCITHCFPRQFSQEEKTIKYRKIVYFVLKNLFKTFFVKMLKKQRCFDSTPLKFAMTVRNNEECVVVSK